MSELKTQPPPPRGDISPKGLREFVAEERREISRRLARLNDLEEAANRMEGA